MSLTKKTTKIKSDLLVTRQRGIGQGSRTFSLQNAPLDCGPFTSETEESGSEYFPTPRKKSRFEVQLEESPASKIVDSSNCFLFTEKKALDNFIENVSILRPCETEGCEGILVPTKVDRVGLGGAGRIMYSCSGCKDEGLHFNSSTYVFESRRSVVSLAVSVAFILSGNTHAGYHKTLARGLGIPVLTGANYYEAIKILYAPIRDMLDEICSQAKSSMNEIPEDTLGSWRKAVTTADGCWLTRGHFSQNLTFIVKNYLNNALLYYCHLCMRGNDHLIEEPLYPGTSKSVEGHMVRILFQRAKDEGCKVSVNWQDSDSSAAKAISDVYQDVQIMYCSGHVGRAHGNQLIDRKTSKSFSAAFIRKYKAKFPSITEVKCVCSGKNHHQGCGCITDGFIRSAKINHFLCCIQAENNPAIYEQRMRELGKYHARGKHQWEDGQCSFHPHRLCSCGKCGEDASEEDLACTGKDYTSKFVLSCPLHALAYEIECDTRAQRAASVIHPDLGRGHSNLCEAAFSVLPTFRSKDQPLHRLSYITLTNWGLIMSCMSYLTSVHGNNYNLYIGLYEKLHLPIVDGLSDIWSLDMEDREAILHMRKDDHMKKYHILMKVARQDEQEERK